MLRLDVFGFAYSPFGRLLFGLAWDRSLMIFSFACICMVVHALLWAQLVWEDCWALGLGDLGGGMPLVAVPGHPPQFSSSPQILHKDPS